MITLSLNKLVGAKQLAAHAIAVASRVARGSELFSTLSITGSSLVYSCGQLFV